VEAARDLGCADLWQRSLERSLARRGKSPRCSMELQRLAGARDLSRAEPLRESATYSALRRRSQERTAMPLVAASGASAVALVATFGSLLVGRGGGGSGAQRIAFKRSSALASASVVPAAAVSAPTVGVAPTRPEPATSASASTPRTSTGAASVPQRPAARSIQSNTQPHVRRARAHAAQAQPDTSGVHPHGLVMATMARAGSAPGTGGVAVGSPARAVTTTGISSHGRGTGRHHRTRARHSRHSGGASPRQGVVAQHPSTGGYVNPLAGASVTPERIDQGVDYAGTGTLSAIGAATVTYVGTSGTGWPGAFIEYRLLGGSNAGRYVYYAEGVTPASGLHVGQRVNAGQPIVHLIPGWSSGIEVGWGAGIGTETYAMQTGGWSSQMDQSNGASAAGKSFSALIVSLGGPGGKVEG
jgi:hypothetical protein